MKMQRHKKILVTLILSVLISTIAPQRSDAQVLEIIKAAVVKVIKAIDLRIQRLQTKTIWLQNAQKVLENKLSKFKLDE